jgi:predicted nucleic acid-binding protein
VYTLDTNAIIYYLDRDPAVVVLLDRLFDDVDATFYVSTVTELELYSYPDLNDDEEAAITRLLTDMFVVPLDSRLARYAGYLRRLYRSRNGHHIAAGGLSTPAVGRGSVIAHPEPDPAEC